MIVRRFNDVRAFNADGTTGEVSSVVGAGSSFVSGHIWPGVITGVLVFTITRLIDRILFERK